MKDDLVELLEFLRREASLEEEWFAEELLRAANAIESLQSDLLRMREALKRVKVRLSGSTSIVDAMISLDLINEALTPQERGE